MKHAESSEVPKIAAQSLGSLKVIRSIEKAPDAPAHWKTKQRILFQIGPQQKKESQIPSLPLRNFRIAGLEDNFYFSVLDWSSDNLIAIAAGSQIMIYNFTAAQHFELATMPSTVSSLKFAPDPQFIAVATTSGELSIFLIQDQDSSRCVRTLPSSSGRIGALSWKGNILSAGDDSGRISHYDVSLKEPLINRVHAHEQEVVGLAWNSNGSLLASGSNDNVVKIWDDETATKPLRVFNEHSGAVKAIAWSQRDPNIIATAGGIVDRKILLWRAETGETIEKIETTSQVTTLIFSKFDNKLVASHGYPDNCLSVYDLDSGELMADLRSHSSRVLHTALSPDALCVASAGGCSFCIWQIFETKKKEAKEGLGQSLSRSLIKP